MSTNLDSAMREAAFGRVLSLASARGDVTSADLRMGFSFEGARIPLINPQRGIFKPRQMTRLLSILTAYPRRGSKVWYDDQRGVHEQIYQGKDTIDYSFMGRNTDAADNRWLRDAMTDRVPIVYFLGVAPGVYQPILPAYVVGWDAVRLRAQIAFGAQEVRVPEYPATSSERRYALREVKQRLHQASFREAVISAYGGKCAVTGLPEQRLLDAAHIVADSDEKFGHPVVPNGLPLSKIHHAAFDAHLLGIDADFKVHISERLLRRQDGPMLEVMKQTHGARLFLPVRAKDHPDRDRLAMRFDVYQGYN